MSAVVELLKKEASDLRSLVAEKEEWAQVKSAAVEALVQSGIKRDVAEQILTNLESEIGG